MASLQSQSAVKRKASDPSDDDNCRQHKLRKTTSLHNGDTGAGTKLNKQTAVGTANKDPAAERCLALREIREAILSKMCMKDLFRARGICKAFKEDIDESPTLQRRLCLKPLAQDPHKRYVSPVLNTMLLVFGIDVLSLLSTFLTSTTPV